LAFPQRGANDRGSSGPGNLKINHRIRAKQVRVVEGETQLGVMMLQDAIKKAEEAGMDLVEVSPMSTPPVCRIMDYGKYKYETKKQANESRKKQTVMEIKEVKLRPKTDEHDVDFKVKHIQRFLEEGNKVKVTIMFRGREITHAEIGRDILKAVAETVKAAGQVESVPKIEGKNMFMVLAPMKRSGGGAARPAPSPSPTVGSASAPISRPAARTSGPEIEVKQKPRPAAAPAAVVSASEEKK
jgi:translation initiation factor IF-3